MSLDTIQLIVCLKYNANNTVNLHIPSVDPTCFHGATKLGTDHILFSSTIEFIVLLDKVLEFIVLRRLLLLLGQIKPTPVVNFDVIRRRSIPMLPSCLRPTSYQDRPDKIVGEIKDSDDDVSFLNKINNS